MFRKTVFIALCGLIATPALAKTVEFRGALTREACFEKIANVSVEPCKKLSAGKDNSCSITVDYNNDNTPNKIRIQAAAFASTGDRRSDTLKVRLDKPYLYNAEGFGYYAKVDNDTSLEIFQKRSNMAISKSNIYVKHVFYKDGSRSFNQYACRNLRAVR